MSEIESIIIGGGFAGLFLALGLIERGYKAFLLVEEHKSLGGYAIRGGVKIGLLPAGTRTKKLLPSGFYELYEKRFVERFGKYLENPTDVARDIEFPVQGFINKRYTSYILSRQNGVQLVDEIKKTIRKYVVQSRVTNIVSLDNGYSIDGVRDRAISCKNLIIASGRSDAIIGCMERIGERYSNSHDCLVGIRACFKSTTAENLFRHQTDFKIKDNNDYQTYCFNYKGDVQSYSYKDRMIYTGCFNNKRLLGNCFIGKRVQACPKSILNQIGKHSRTSYAQFLNRRWPEPLDGIFSGIVKFMNKMEKSFNIKFTHIYYPALEQFWPRPEINALTLESIALPNVFYVGDASGISFGVLQTYITANALIQEFERRNVFH